MNFETQGRRMSKQTRRDWIRNTAAGLLATTFPVIRRAGADPNPRRDGCTLSIGTYSMKSLSLEDAITVVAEVGYDGIEIATQPGFDGEPSRMTGRRREEVRRRIVDRGLKLTALMEQIEPSPDDKQHRNQLDRLQRAFELAHDLGPERPPLVQTVLGGGRWEERQGLFRDRLADWLALARGTKVVIAIKPHRGGAMSRPSEAIWLIRQLGDSPWLRMVYDYSHYAFRDMPLEETIRTSLPYTAHIAVKDAVRDGDRVKFDLPGASGKFDYATLLRLFFQGGYRGDVCCEVSSMVSSKPGYDPVAAAKSCYRNMARAFKDADVPRS
jgi:sugar phosphate isomerase/epimerase